MSSSILAELPIDSFIPEILKTLSQHSRLVLNAAPGAGKTTRIPPALLQVTSQKILVLEPRRIAAIAAATRICEEHNWDLGKQVGYQVRFESQTSPLTRLCFLTEALLSKKMIQNPDLHDVGIVIIDEFHERSIHTDLALGLLFELQQLNRPDLKIVVMSATLQTQPIADFLENAPTIEVPGKTFPIQITSIKENQLLLTGETFVDRIVKTTKEACSLTQKDILVFLPGVREIEKVYKNLESWGEKNNFLLKKLYGQQSLAEQKSALQRAAQRRIILSTNIAESALTVDGVDTVIDSGLERTVSLNLTTGLPRIYLTRISKASASQRAGRAGRQGPGFVFQLWNKLDESSMVDFQIADVLRTDLCEPILFLSCLGIRDFASFSWFEKPPQRRIDMALNQLIKWGAINKFRSLTEVGEKMSSLPLHPRLARLMIEAECRGFVNEGAEICAILSEKDLFTSLPEVGPQQSDLFFRWEIFCQNKQKFFIYEKLAQSIRRLFPSSKPTAKGQTSFPFTEYDLERILLPAYGDLLCRRRGADSSKGIKIDGVGVRLANHSLVKKSEFFFALQIMEGTATNSSSSSSSPSSSFPNASSSSEASVSLASGISKDLILEYFAHQIQEISDIHYDEKNQRLVKTITKKLDLLPLEDPRPVPLSASEIESHLPTVAIKEWDLLLRLNNPLQEWLCRWDWYINHSHLKDLTTLSEDQKRNAMIQACSGCRDFQDLAEKDLVYFVELQIPKPVLNAFHRDCPDRLEVPTGHRLKVHYSKNKNPHLEVRLQEIFGWAETPKIMNGKIPITVHLLGPNYRPLQVTQDLSNFWKTAYQDMRRELRAKYPKHSWPEDPLTAKPVAKGRRPR